MLITEILKKNPDERIGLGGIMNSDWVKKNLKKDILDQKSSEHMTQVLKNMQAFKVNKIYKVTGNEIQYH